jgi:cell division cycle 14
MDTIRLHASMQAVPDESQEVQPKMMSYLAPKGVVAPSLVSDWLSGFFWPVTEADECCKLADGCERLEAIEGISGRLYFAAGLTMPQDTPSTHYFCIDNELVYEAFWADFGPLDIAKLASYCRLLSAKLEDPQFHGRRLVHWCTSFSKPRTNAACLFAGFQVAVLGKTPEAAFRPFLNINPPFLDFCDASRDPKTFALTVTDVLLGLRKGIEMNWFNWRRFDIRDWKFFSDPRKGDMNWIIPGKFLAFAGPCSRHHPPPEHYVPIFQRLGVKLVVRLNENHYDRSRFVDHGIDHLDLFFPDGSCPPPHIISEFIAKSEAAQGAVAVHCTAGLGRTGTLIGLYAMKHFSFPARAWIGWNRLCRPGSVLWKQQQFMVDIEASMFQAGAAMRAGNPWTALGDVRHFNKLANPVSIYQDDAGQAERLLDAKHARHMARHVSKDSSRSTAASGSAGDGLKSISSDYFSDSSNSVEDEGSCGMSKLPRHAQGF